MNVPNTTKYRAGDSVTITGASLSGAVVKINNIVCTILQNNSTVVVFTYPALPAGIYEIFITVANGWTYPKIISST